MTSDDPRAGSGEVSPEQRVGAAMREAREYAGISLRTMAQRLGYHSHTTLSSHERGAVMPTDEAVTGYERELGLKPGTLGRLLEDARIQRHGDAWAKRRLHLRPSFVDQELLPADSVQGSHGRRWLGGGTLIIVSSAIILGLAAFLVVNLLGSRHKPAHAPASSVAGVRDGSDPKVTGCAADAVTADSVDVFDPPEHLVGALQLRSSPRCGTNWGRFVPVSTLNVKPKLTLEINVYRPADGAAARFQVTYDGLPAYGNMLISSHECVYAQLTFQRRQQSVPPAVQTACRKSPGR